jgi:dolichol-phosphate mannosyltransferase
VFLSVIIPIFNEEKTIEPLWQRLRPVLDALPGRAEVIFVNDGSTDGTADQVRRLRQADPRVRALHLSRNFGHQRAITAGLDYAEGQACVIMDGDLQDPPELIPQLLEKWQGGSHVVHAIRRARKGETRLKRWTSQAFYRLLQHLTNTPIPTDVGDFRLIDRKIVIALRSLRERGRFLRGMINWVGYTQASVPFERESRVAGRTKYSFPRMWRLAIDAITSFSIIPLQLATTLGLIISAGTFLFAVYVLYAHWVAGRTITGWTSLMIVLLFFGGVQLMFLGVLGEYVGRIFEEVKQRPLYLIETMDGFDPDDRKPL